MASADKLPEGRFQCYIAASNLRFFDLKIIVPLKIEVGAEIIETDEFWTCDGSLVTSGGKKRAAFTMEALEVLGAADPVNEILDALEKGATSVQLSGLEQPKWVECVVSHSNGYANVSIYKPKATADAASVKKATAGLRSLGGAKKGPDPFAPPPGRGTPIAPPARREPPRNEITPEEAAAMAEEPGFPFGANAPAR